MEYLENDDLVLRGLAVTCLGHVARIHEKLDKEKVIPALEKHIDDNRLRCRFFDAFDDIGMFLKMSDEERKKFQAIF